MSTEILITESLPYPGEEAKCAGNLPSTECRVAKDLAAGTKLSEAERLHAAIQATGGAEEFAYPSVQSYFPLGCVVCRMMCEAVYKKIDGIRVDEEPAVLWMDPETYPRVREHALKNLTRLLLASIAPKKDILTGLDPD